MLKCRNGKKVKNYQKHPHTCLEAQWDSLLKDTELLASAHVGRGQPLLQLKGWGRGLTRKWQSFPKPPFSLSPKLRLHSDGDLDHMSLPKWEAKKTWWKFPLKFRGERLEYRNILTATSLKQEKPLRAARPGNTRRHQSSFSAFPGGNSWVSGPGFTNEAI